MQRRDDALAAVRFRSPKILSREMKIYLYKTSFSVASLYYPSVRNAVVDLENRSDSDTIFFSKPSKAPIAIIIWLSVHKIHARTLHIETMSSIILFIFKRLKMKKKKVNTGQTIHHVEEMIFTDLSVRLLRSRTTFWTSFVSDRRWKSFLTF